MAVFIFPQFFPNLNSWDYFHLQLTYNFFSSYTVKANAMNRTKVKSNHVESGSDESNNSSHKNQLDLSLLRKPIRTSVEGFEEVFRAFRDGTDEVRNLLMDFRAIFFKFNFSISFANYYQKNVT